MFLDKGGMISIVYKVGVEGKYLMKLTVSFFGPIRRPWPESTRGLQVEQGTTVEDLLVTLGYRVEDMRRVATVVNGKRKSLATELRDGDDLRFVLLAGGG